MGNPKHSAYFAAVAVILTATIASRADVTYQVTDLGDLGGGSSFAGALSDNGSVVGYTALGDGSTTSFLWNTSTGMTNLGWLSPNNSNAWGISADGSVVAGRSDVPSGNEAYVWTSSQGMQGIGWLPGLTQYSAAGAVSADASTVVGWAAAGQSEGAFVWNKGTGMSPLGALPGATMSVVNGYGITGSNALGVSSDGSKIVGWSTTSTGNVHAFVDANGAMADLGTVSGDANSRANSINSSGEAVGFSTPAQIDFTGTATGVTHAFVASGGTVTNLGTLGGSSSDATAINNGGEIVGYSNIIGNAATHAFISNGSSMADLNTLLAPSSGWTLNQATAINNNGQIAGTGVNSAGETHAFLLTPTIPVEPVTRLPTATLIAVTKADAASGALVTFNPSAPAGSAPFFTSSFFYQSSNSVGGAGYINPALPTVVLTHGYISDATMWNDLAQKYPGAGTSINLVAWNWSSDASIGHPLGQQASITAPAEGDLLGGALLNALGSDYHLPIHFIGHSLGTLVNAEAVNKFDTQTRDGDKTQVTIFDDAAIANEFPSSGGYSPSVPSVGVARIDNYVSAFGNLVTLPNATNVILDYGQSATFYGVHNDASFHSYPIDWYKASLQPLLPGFFSEGYGWALDNTATNLNFPAPQNYQQIIGGVLNPISPDTAKGLIDKRNSTVQEGFFFSLATAVDLNATPVSTNGTVSASLVGPIYGLKFILGGLGAIPHADAAVQNAASPPSSPSYAWVQIHIPSGAVGMSFDLAFSGVDPSDQLMVGIDNNQIFALQGATVTDGVAQNSGVVDVSTWAGQDVELFLGDTGIAPSGTMDIENLGFEIVPEPGSFAFAAIGVPMLLRRRRTLH